MKLAIPLLAIATLLPGCSHPPFNQSAKSSPIGMAKLQRYFDDPIVQTLEFHDQYSNLTMEAQKKVFADTTQALQKDKLHPLNRVRMATMLSIPTSHARDPVKAQPLLRDLMNDQTLQPELHTYVGMLYEFSLDYARQQQKLKEASKQSDQVDQKYQLLLKKYEALEQKIHALKTIEKSINAR